MVDNRIISIINMNSGGWEETHNTLNLAYTLASEYKKKRFKLGKMWATVGGGII